MTIVKTQFRVNPTLSVKRYFERKGVSLVWEETMRKKRIVIDDELNDTVKAVTRGGLSKKEEH